jgi:hypothetical protein
VFHLDDVDELGLRRRIDAADARRFHRASEEDAHFEKVSFRADEEVTRFPREHDRLVRGVDPLLAEVRRRFAQPLPGLTEIV